MAYSQGGKIEATDINGFVSTGTPNFNNIWSVGSADSGYGQPALSTVAVGDKVAQDPWNSLVTNIAKAAAHQNTTITTTTAPLTGDKIQWLSALSTNLGLVNTNRLNAVAQSGTVDNISTSSSTWSNNLTVTFTVTFSSGNAARYFFNAGGQIGIQCSHPVGVGSSINQLINDICGDAGTMWLSSPTLGTARIAGFDYNGVTKVGGNPGGETVSTNSGFHALSTTPTQLFKQYGNFVYDAYETGTFVSVSASSNGAGVITITVVYDEVPNGALVSSGTVTTLTVRSPSSAQITDTWGVPTLSNSFVAL
jgi:hypothetical protein